MNILVIGGGGREHALIWKLRQSPRVTRMFCAPGNAGIGQIATCVPIPVTDHAALVKLAQDKRIQIVGINYNDQADNARRFLGRYGNPIAATGVDPNGRAAIEWGVYGVPETFVVGRDGRIAYKLIGPITPQNLEVALRPAIEKALKGG